MRTKAEDDLFEYLSSVRFSKDGKTGRIKIPETLPEEADEMEKAFDIRGTTGKPDAGVVRRRRPAQSAAEASAASAGPQVTGDGRVDGPSGNGGQGLADDAALRCRFCGERLSKTKGGSVKLRVKSRVIAFVNGQAMMKCPGCEQDTPLKGVTIRIEPGRG